MTWRDPDGNEIGFAGAPLRPVLGRTYGALMGMPPDRMAAILANLLSAEGTATVPTEDECVRLLREAGFGRVTRFFSALGVITGWLAR